MKASLQDLLNYDYTITEFTASHITEELSSYNDYSTRARYKNMLLYLAEGDMEYFNPQGERLFEINAGDVLFIADKTSYVSKVLESGMRIRGIVICFNIENSGGEIVKIIDSFCLLASDSEKKLYKKFNSLSAKILENQCLLAVKSAFFDLLYSLLTNKLMLKTQAGELLPALEFIKSNPEKNVSIKELAQMCQMSESSFSHKFTKHTNGITPIQLRNRIRLMKAEEMANGTNLSAENIASALGFYDASYLCRYYKRQTGKTLKAKRLEK